MQLLFVLPPENVSTHMRNKVIKAFRSRQQEVSCIYHSEELFSRDASCLSGDERIYCIAFKRRYFIQLIKWIERQRQAGFNGKIILSIETESFDYEVIHKFLATGGNTIVSLKEWQENPLLLLEDHHCNEVASWLHNQTHHKGIQLYNEDALSFLYQQLIDEDQVSLSSVAYIYDALDKKHKDHFMSFIKEKMPSFHWKDSFLKQIDFLGEGLITVWDKAEFASELAVHVAKKTKKKVLLMDLDRLNPCIDFYCGSSAKVKDDWVKELIGIQKIYTENGSGDDYDALCVSHRDLPNLKVLYGAADLKQFEYYTNEALLDALTYYKKRYDLVITNVNGFIYDAYTCLSLITSDLNILPIDGSLNAIRHCQRSMRLLEEKQKLNLDKCTYILFDYYTRDNQSMKLLSEMIGGKMIGEIEKCKKRDDYRNLKKSYAKHMSSKVKKSYDHLLKVLNMEVL